MTEDKYIVVFCTVPNEIVGRTIADELVGCRLAACVNIVPGLTSVYRWKGKIETDVEMLLIIKTIRSKYSGLEKKIREIHPYDVPEIIALDITSGSSDYLKWISKSVSIKN